MIKFKKVNIEKRAVEEYQITLKNKVRDVHRKALIATANEVKAIIRNEAKNAFNVKKSSFPNSFRTTIYKDNKERLAAVNFWSSVHYSGIHENGGSISKKVLIPLVNFDKTRKRLSTKKFKESIEYLDRKGKLFYEKSKSGNGTVLYALANNTDKNNEVIKGYSSKFNKLSTSDKAGKKKETAVPIAVLKSNISLKRKFSMKNIIQREFNKIMSKNFKAEFNTVN